MPMGSARYCESALRDQESMIRKITAFLVLLFIASPAFAEMIILPLGDSITASAKTKSYRYYLQDTLTKNGYEFNFVGSKKNQTFDNFDPDHEGRSGWRADEISRYLGDWLKGYTPDVVLLHIGHNDIFDGETTAEIIADIEKIIDLLQADNPKVTIFLAQIIYPNWNNTKWSNLNQEIPGLAERKTTAKSSVIPVNQNETFIPAEDTIDNCHPNDSGDQKIAQQWYKSIVSVFPPETSAIVKTLMPPKLRIKLVF
jgi:lysophospholipase L1-like esterase